MISIKKGRKNCNTFIQFDVEHGECNFLLDKKNDFLLIDCGSKAPLQNSWVPQLIENYCQGMQSSLILTHYHDDHYSLFHHFQNPSQFLKKIYVPKVPIHKSYASGLLFEIIALAILSNYSYFNVLPKVFNCGAKIIECDSRCIIPEFGQQFNVFWPDFSYFNVNQNEEQMYRRILAGLKKIEKELDISIEVDKDKSFVENIRRLREKYEDIEEEKRSIIKDTIREFGSAFSDVANLHSLGFNSKYKRKDRYLVLGDIPSNVLNHVIIPGKPQYDIIKAAHHGTEFGTQLSNIQATYVLISRNTKKRKIKPIDTRYSQIAKTIMNTETDGTCIIT